MLSFNGNGLFDTNGLFIKTKDKKIEIDNNI